MLKRFFSILVFVLATAVSIFATKIPVASYNMTTSWTFGGSTADLRIYATKTFVTTTGETIVGGTTSGFYQTITCTVSGATVTCPQFTIDSTTDSTVPTAKYVADLYSNVGGELKLRIRFMEPFSVPISLGTSVTWAQLRAYNAAPTPPLPNSYYTADQVQAALNAKQPTLSSGINIKTINGTSLLGSGDLAVGGASASLSGYTVQNSKDATTFNINSPTIMMDMADILATTVAKLQANTVPGAAISNSATANSQSKITTNWSAPSSGATATGYILERATNSGFTAGVADTSVGNVTTYQLTHLTPATTYYFRIAALDANGNQGAWSASVNATTNAALTVPSTGLWAYYEADSYSQADGSSITTNWTDRSGHSRDGTLVGTVTFIANQLNADQPVLRVGTSGKGGFALPDTSALSAGEIFVVTKYSGANLTTDDIWMNFGTSGTDQFAPWLGFVATNFGSTVRHDYGPISTWTGWHYFDIWSATNDHGAIKDGVTTVGTSGTNTVSFTATPTVGYLNDGNYYVGDIEGVYIFSSKLSAPDRAAMIAYIQEKTALP